MTGYLAVIGAPAPPLIDAIAELVRQGWKTALAHSGLLVLHAPATTCLLLPDQRGAVLGTIFARWPSRPLADIGDAEARRIAAAGAAGLIERCWGGYVALLDRGGSVETLRPPFGDLPCWWVQSGRALAVASEVRLLARIGAFAPSVDREALGAQLLFPALRPASTCLAGVHELPGGDRLRFAGGELRRETLWSPWEQGAGATMEDPREASSRLRDIVTECVGARVRPRVPALLKLSGGLDSSIVAAALARANIPFSCVNFVSHDRSGDERLFAAQVGTALGVTVHEALRRAEAVDIGQSASAHLPRPTVRSFTLESDRIAAQVADRTGATMLLDGGGGDNVFCSLQSAAPVADRLLTFGFGGETWRTAVDVCQLTQSRLTSVLWQGYRRARGRRRSRPWSADRRLLDPRFTRSQPGLASHAWFDAPRDALPGKAGHIALLLAAQNAVGDQQPGALPGCAPLLSQPVVELCLRIPSWLWIGEGYNRLTARRAFAQDLPCDIAFRRSKGSPESFVAELFEANRTRIFEMLLDGALARQRLLDRPALEAMRASPAVSIGREIGRVMRLLDAELWVQAWTHPDRRG